VNRMVYELRRRRWTAVGGNRVRRWRLWASALADRYRRSPRPISRAGLVLPSRAPSAVRRQLQPVSLAQVTVRAFATAASRERRRPAIEPPTGPPGSGQAGSVVSAGNVRPIAARTPARHPRVAQLRRPAHEAITPGGVGVTVLVCRNTIERLAGHGRRVDTSRAALRLIDEPHRTAAPPLMPTAVSAAPRATAPRRESPPAAMSGPATSLAESTDPRSADGMRPERVDLEQLADHVVRRIDERIIAHRERLGRI
jgi:hypothetical protein